MIPPEQLDDTIFVKYVTHVEHGIVVRADDTQAKCDRIDPSELTGYDRVIVAVDPEPGRTIRKYCVPKSSVAPTIDVRTTSFTTGLQLVQQGNFVVSASLQLARRIETEGLVIRPTLLGMPQRPAGLYVRDSAVGYREIQTTIEYFDETAKRPEADVR